MPTMPLSTIARAALSAYEGPDDPAVAADRPRRGPLAALRAAARGDDGDVPGWVLVTLMTAGLVLAIWAVAGPALTNLFTTAIARVTSFGG